MTEELSSNTNSELIALTAEIVSSHVSNNSVPSSEIAALIANVYSALSGLGTPAAPAEVERPKGAVGIRASIKPDHLISMIDGKPYKMLRRHLTRNGYTPESYRETFGLPRDYPMVSAGHSEKRRNSALRSGLGRKPVEDKAPSKK